MKAKVGDIYEIYHPELKTKVRYKIIFEYGKYKGVRLPKRMAEDADINWLLNKGEKISKEFKK